MAHQETVWTCPECQNTSTNYKTKIIETGKPIPFPRYTLQIKESCDSCGRYKRFAPQTKKLINRINTRMETILLPAKDE